MTAGFTCAHKEILDHIRDDGYVITHHASTRMQYTISNRPERERRIAEALDLAARGMSVERAARHAGVGLSAVLRAAGGRFPRGRRGRFVPCPPPEHPVASSARAASAARPATSLGLPADRVPAGRLTHQPAAPSPHRVIFRTALTSAPVPRSGVSYTRRALLSAALSLLSPSRRRTAGPGCRAGGHESARERRFRRSRRYIPAATAIPTAARRGRPYPAKLTASPRR